MIFQESETMELKAVVVDDVENLLKTSTSTASRILRQMVKNNLLEPWGKARSTKYILSLSTERA